MDDLQHRLLVSQWIAEEFAGIIDEDRRAKLEAWRKESAGNEQEYQELLQEFRSGDILEPYPEEEIGRQWKKFSKRNRTIHPVFRYWYRYVALIVLLLGAAGVLKWMRLVKRVKGLLRRLVWLREVLCWYWPMAEQCC